MRFVAFFMSRSTICKVTTFFRIDKLFFCFFYGDLSLLLWKMLFCNDLWICIFFIFELFFREIMHSIDTRMIDLEKSRIIRKKIVYLHIYY